MPEPVVVFPGHVSTDVDHVCERQEGEGARDHGGPGYPGRAATNRNHADHQKYDGLRRPIHS